MLTWHWSNGNEALGEWDAFLQKSARGHYLQLSEWIKAYTIYGFTYDLLTGKNESGEICVGCCLVVVRIVGLRFVILPAGPIIDFGYEDELESCLEKFMIRSKYYKAVYAHVNLPACDQHQANFAFAESSIKPTSIFHSGIPGLIFKQVTSINGVRWVDLIAAHKLTDDELLLKFPAKTRRDIRASLRKNISLNYAKLDDEIEQAYHSIEENARIEGYGVRPWENIKEALTNMVNAGQSHVLVARHEGEIKGVVWLFDVGRRLTYNMGASIKEKPDLLIGYFLQWQAIKLSVELGYEGYDISTGGTPGVVRFKEKFSSKHVQFNHQRHWIFRPVLFFIFQKIYHTFGSKGKRVISQLLRR